MKNLILFVALITFGCKAQQIILPIEDYEIYETDLQDNTYVKDVNNLLDIYLGTWVGSKNGNQYEFIITKEIYSFLDVNMDKLFMRYKITGGVFNTVLIDTSLLPSENTLVTKGSHLDIENNNYVLNYFGVNSQCGQNGTIFLHPNGETQMYFSYLRTGEQVDENCASTAEQLMPNAIVLTKQ